MTPEEYIVRLLEASDKKYKLLENMLGLTQQQTETIHEDGLEALDRLVDQKQKLIDEINKCDETFEFYYQRLKQALKVKSLEEAKYMENAGIKQLQERIGKITALTEQISSLEKQNNTKAKELLDTLAGEIRKMNLSKKANSAYTPGIGLQQASYFIDKKK